MTGSRITLVAMLAFGIATLTIAGGTAEATPAGASGAPTANTLDAPGTNGICYINDDGETVCLCEDSELCKGVGSLTRTARLSSHGSAPCIVVDGEVVCICEDPRCASVGSVTGRL